MTNRFRNPKNRKARYHRVTLSSGHILEIGWHFGRQKYCVSIYHPTKAQEPDCWNAETQFFGDSPREVLSGARLAIAEEINPEIREVRRRVQGGRKTDGQLGGLNLGEPIFDEFLDISDFEKFASDAGIALKYLFSGADKKSQGDE